MHHNHTAPLRAAVALTGLLLALTTAGCPEDNPRYCTVDSECQDATREGYDPARPHCHGEGNFCYEGCATHADCADTSKSWYRLDRPTCDPVAHDCVAGAPPDGGGEGLPADGAEAGPDDAGVDVDAPATKLDGWKACQAPSWCKSGFCADKVCCDKACTGTCQACDLAGTKGSCTFIPNSAGPQADCPGDALCGNGSCDGAGACSYPKAGTTCKTSCAMGKLTTSTCDAKHACTAGAPVSCTPTVCDAAGTVCLKGCKGHADCVTGSVCDRSGAHTATQAGLGTCIGTAKVVTVGASSTYKTISAGLATVGAGKTHLLVTKGTYNEKVVVPASMKVTLAGSGLPEIVAGTGGQPVVKVGTNSTVVLQGLKLTGALGGSGADGVFCQGSGSSSTSKLTVLESTIKSNEGHGMVGTYCDVTLRRNLVLSNQAGGVKLADGTFTIVNNVVAKNGVLNTSNLGGMSLNTTGKATIYNNTVASNLAKSTVAGGIKCNGGETIVNAIVRGNLGSGQVQSCAVTYSNVQGGASGTGNIDLPPQFVNEAKGNFSLKTTSTSIDKGTTTTGVTAIDLTGGPRKKGSATDQGAYEVQ